MADNTTELEVLNQIVEVLGGQSGQYETVVPVLEDIRDLLSGGGGGGGGYNPSLSVGRADALTGADSTAQWATRESTGSGAATVRSVQGAAVAWGQMVLFSSDTQTSSNGVTFQRKTDGTVTASGTADGGDGYTTLTFGVFAGHKYLTRGCPEGGSTSTYMSYITGVGFPFAGYQDIGHGAILSPANDGSATYVLANIKNGITVDNLVFRPQLFDLTTMFGSGNEPTTVAEFERMFPEAYYPYSAPTLKPVRIAGIASTDADDEALDSVEWETYTLRAAGSVRDELTADELVTRVGVVDLGTLNWQRSSTRMLSPTALTAAPSPNIGTTTAPNASCALYTPTKWTDVSEQYDKTIGVVGAQVIVQDSAYTDPAEFKAAMSGVILYYELATPTTTEIDPPLPMTYRVEQGGTESIVVPDGEISAAPLLTIAEGESAADVVMDALACIATPDGPTATANHAINTYLTMGGKLYKVTSAIAVGETITPNTNVTETTVMAELLALTA